MKKFILLSGLLFSLLFLGFFLLHPAKLNSASLTTSSATLGNSRLSYRAGVGVGVSAGVTAIDIDASGNGDNNTNHLFPNDTICFPDSGENGCKNQTTYTVSNIIDTDTFTFTPGAAGALISTDLAIATQSGTLTIAFTTVNEIPSNGDILITIPAVNTTGKTCDGIPDTAASLGANGFDLSTVAAADISVTGCTDANWNATETVTCGTTSADHTIRIDRQTSSCAAGTAITVTIDSSPGIINPAPLTSGHTQGTADNYTITATTRDGSDNTLDTVDMKAAPVEAVLVSATVDETLSFAVAAIGTGSSACGQTTDVTTTVYSVPWGTLSTADSFSEAAQQLTVSTNAGGGYTVKIEENDQMGKNGGTCTGTSPSADGFTFGSTSCIRDTACGVSTCTEAAARDWTSASSYQGLGISLQDVSGTDAVWDYDGKAGETTCTTGTFCARQIADVTQGSETAATIMSNSAPVSSKQIYTCYRIAISGTQPAGYYYNKVKYTATATF